MTGYEITFFIVLASALITFLFLGASFLCDGEGELIIALFFVLFPSVGLVAMGLEGSSQKYNSQAEISSKSLTIISKTEVPEGISVLFSLDGATEQRIFEKHSDVKTLLNGGALYSVDYFHFNAFGMDYNENKIEVRQPPVEVSEYFLMENINGGWGEEPSKRDGENHWSLQEDFFRKSENTWKVETHDLILDSSAETLVETETELLDSHE
jgi:hypothetical protein